MSFLSPLLLGGLILASVPIIIHLLNRRRFQRVEWAPMKYLKLTLRTNRRRLRLEQWILLALRTLAIALLVFAVARPVLSSTGVGAWLTSRARTSRLIVLDDSLSMGYRDAGLSAFDRAKTAADEFVRTLGPQDSVTAILTSAPQAPLVKDASLADPSNLLKLLNAAPLSDMRSQWEGTFKAVEAHLASSPFPRQEVLLITDLRKAGWDATVEATASQWAKRDVALKIIDVGSAATDDVLIESLATEDPVILAGMPLRLRAALRNNTGGTIPPGQATLTVGEASQPVMLPELPPNQVTEVSISVAAQTPGQVAIRLTLSNDALPGDDVRWLAVTIKPKLDITLVDGDPSATPFESETDFLALALTAGREPWQTNRLTDSEFLAAPDALPDVLILANLASLTPQRVAALERQVREMGVGLMIFAGDQVETEAYNTLLWKEGNGLLPARLEQVIEEPVKGLVIDSADASPLDPLRKIAPAALTRIEVRKLLSVSPRLSEESRVLAHWNNAAASAAIIEKPLGRGRVVLVTVPADKQWGDWPVDPTYVLSMRSIVAAIARGEPYWSNVIAGHAIRLPTSKGAPLNNPRVMTSFAGAPLPAMITKDDAGNPLIEYRDTVLAGRYTIAYQGTADAEQSGMFVANPDLAESALDLLAPAELTTMLGGLEPSIIRFADRDAALSPEGREIWRTLALIVLGLFLAESAFAVWVGRER